MKQRKTRFPLILRLLGTALAFWLVLLSITLSVTLRFSLRALETKIDEILQSTVMTLAETPSVRQVVRDGVCPPEMRDFLDDIVANTEDLEYITIADADSIRIYHADPAFVGLPFEGGDQDRVLRGESYLSDASPEHFGDQHRAFHPVTEEDGTVIGFVMAAATHDRIAQLRDQIVYTYLRMFLMLTLVSMLIGLPMIYWLGRTLRGVRPEDLLRAYLTQNDMLNALDEGLISFDNTGRVRLVNAAAARMLGHREDLLLGQNIDSILLDEGGASLRNRESQGLQTNRANILVRPVQLPDSNLWARQVLVLADKSELMRYAEELGGTRHMINTLRANTHEFLNKLQVISGLLQMGYVAEAQEYIGNVSAVHEHIVGPVMQLIRNSSVAALILGKEGSMREMDVSLKLMKNSSLPEHSRYLSTQEMVIILGNLLENAMEAVNAVPDAALRSVVLQITEDDKGLYLMVSDTGEGITAENLPHIYKSGFSTKAQSGRGVGMGLIKEIVDRHGGSIEVDTEPGSGTTITIIFSRERGAQV